MQLTFAEALRSRGAHRRTSDYPGADDARASDRVLWPAFEPRFGLRFDAGLRVFTIGSCFARNIEEALAPLGVDLPTRRFEVPKAEWGGRGNGLLNEYSPGAIAARILDALADAPSPDATIVAAGGRHVDLLLPGPGVTLDRARARREEIRAVYRALPVADVLVVTLGLVECWYDQTTARFLNRIPPPEAARAEPSRFVFRRLDLAETVALLEPAFDAVQAKGIRTVLTVSPVPLSTTFSTDDAVIADGYSKAVLRVAADTLRSNFPSIDYFPSYEIVCSGGLASYSPDHRHVRADLVRRITTWMVDRYAPPSPATAGSMANVQTQSGQVAGCGTPRVS